MGTQPEITPDLEPSQPIEVATGGAVLRVVFPAEVDLEIPLGREPVTLGRGDPLGSPVGLPDGFLSRRHAAIRWDEALGAHVVEDLGSRNGSALDGVALVPGQPAPLAEGSVVRLGRTLAVYERPEDPEAAGNACRDAIPGRSAAIRRLRAQVVRAAREPAPVLVVGPTGVGKERIARELHRLSGRSGQLVTVNTAELSANLIESQLFGHVRGAFTGAASPHAGLFRAAEGGTLFLDEVGELPLELQAKLLRVLEEGEVRPVGSTATVEVDVRVIAATNVDLEQRVADGTFRSDLFARLFHWTIRVPPLSARRSDVLQWLDRMHRRWMAERGDAGPPGLKLSAGAAEEILLHPWPLNLREVRRVALELSARAEDGHVISSADVRDVLGGSAPTPSMPPTPSPPSTPVSLPTRSIAPEAPTPPPSPATAAKKPDPPRSAEELRRILDQTGSVRAAARYYERDRRQVYRWLDAFGMRED